VRVALTKTDVAIDQNCRTYFEFVIVLISTFIKMAAARNVDFLTVKFNAQVCYT